MPKTQLQLLQEFFSANQQTTLDIRERDEGKVLTVLQALTSDATWEDGYKSIQDIRAGVVSTFDENEKEWKGRRVGSALRLLNLRESRVSHGLTQYLIKKAKVDNLVARFHLNASEPEAPTSEISSTISPISTRHAQNHEQRVEKVSKVEQDLATDRSGVGRDGEQGEHHAQTASLPTSTRSTRDMPSIDERFESVRLLHPRVARGQHIDEPGAIPDPSLGSPDVGPQIQVTHQKPQTDDSRGALRVDPVLVRDFITRSVIPGEESSIGYAVTEKIRYQCKYRFGASRELVDECIGELNKKQIIEEHPRQGCWRLKKKGPQA